MQQAREHGVVLQAAENGADLYLSVLAQVFDQNFRLVLLLDSFESITRNKRIGPEFLSFLRSQSSNGKITYVTATVEPLYVLSHKRIKDSPFFNIFDEIKLAELTREEARKLIQEPAKRAGLTFADEEVEWVIKYSGLHPCFILRACAVLFDLKLQSPDKEALKQRFLNKAYSTLKPLFQDTWYRLTKIDKAKIRDKVQNNERDRQFSELTESAFFRQFVRDINKIDLPSKTAENSEKDVKELEGVLKKMQNLGALGDANLHQIKGVERRLNGNASLTSIERGKVIRSVLQEAIEHLRGIGPRTDTEPSWYFYNILDYRYFSRYHLKHREIAARLEFTNDRQYYRKHNAAIAELYNVLVDM